MGENIWILMKSKLPITRWIVNHIFSFKTTYINGKLRNKTLWMKWKLPMRGWIVNHIFSFKTTYINGKLRKKTFTKENTHREILAHESLLWKTLYFYIHNFFQLRQTFYKYCFFFSSFEPPTLPNMKNIYKMFLTNPNCVLPKN